MRFFITLLLFVLPNFAFADVYKYTDEAGKTHYVDNPEKIPEAYKDQLNSQKPFPKIMRVPKIKDYQLSSEPSSETTPVTRGTKKVEVFVTDWCPYCRQLESFLRQKRVRYTRYDIEKDAKGEKLYRQIGGSGVPVIKIGDKVLSGYDPEEIEDALGM